MTEGTAGAVTTWNPGSGQSIKGEDLERSMDHLVDIAKRSGYSEHIARSMKTNKAVCSYDKDSETGEVTFYGDETGEFLLSAEDQNLSFTSSSALHCGFSKGTVDTEEELAAALQLPKWHEVTDYGRRIAKEWLNTANRARSLASVRRQREKPKRSSLPKDLSPDQVTLELALALLALPREVGLHPEDREPIMAGIGRYGPYLSHAGAFRSKTSTRASTTTVPRQVR